MDPLSAIGLASNVVQFVDFASRLISTGTEVYESVSGVTDRTLELERIYKNLSSFSLKLQENGEDQPWGFTTWSGVSAHRPGDVEDQERGENKEKVEEQKRESIAAQKG